MQAQAIVPEALLVTGFLGAGKTTFIRETLVPPLGTGRRFAVLVNDFGEVGFDGPLLRRAGLPVVEVDGGCICCTAGGHLLDALHRVRTDIAPDLLVVEGSGLADPWPLLEALHAEGFQILGAACLVDAAAHARLRSDPLYLRQIDAATLLLVSKSALAGTAATDEAVRFLAQRRSAGAVHVLGDGDDARLLQLLSGEPVALPAQRPSRVHSHAERAWTWRPAGLPSLSALLAQLSGEEGIYRVKGVCQFEESATPIALNWAFGHASTMPLPQPTAGALTFLGPAAGPALAERLPACASWAAGDIGRAGPVPAGAFDARPGVAYVSGRAVGELQAAEALLAFCDVREAELGLVIDAGLSELLTPADRSSVTAVLTDHQYATLQSAASQLAQRGVLRVLILTRAASAEVIAEHFGFHASATVTPRFCLQAPAVALGGLDHRRAGVLMNALGITRHRSAAVESTTHSGGFAAIPRGANLCAPGQSRPRQP